jgi:hypothetical protein
MVKSLLFIIINAYSQAVGLSFYFYYLWTVAGQDIILSKDDMPLKVDFCP